MTREEVFVIHGAMVSKANQQIAEAEKLIALAKQFLEEFLPSEEE